MSSLFIGLLTVFLLIYTAGNYYVGLRIFQSFGTMLEQYRLAYWAGCTLVAATPFVARLGRNYFPGLVNDWITVIGDYWLALIYYFVIIWAIVDILRLVSRFFPAKVSWLQYPSFVIGLGVVFLVCTLISYGAWNARSPRIHHYDIKIDKNIANMASLHVVMVSDVHLGLIVGNDRLDDMVKRINALQPDVVFLAGDTIDEDVSRFVEQKMPEALRKLKTKYGVYAVLGNHEYIGGNSQLAIEHMREAGVTVLRDEYIKVNNSFYVVGRDDKMVSRITGKSRPELAKVMQGIDTSLPIFLIDHQPYNLEEGQQNGVDLQLSGHTHHGQFFPNSFVTERIFEMDWGHVRKGAYQAIVSSGYGTWGPPIRIGNYPEIVDIVIEFPE